jgi:hemoglobin-like flavoprotein
MSAPQLLWTLEQGLGRAWTPEVESAWAEVYGLLSAVMRGAAEQEAMVPQRASA